ncbi:MAG: ABC transporter ATP-binding protein [Candidatus Helarchaeota archaeon]
MDKEIAIKIEHVSKKFCRSLKRSMLYGLADITRNVFGRSSHSENLRKNEFWAVNDVSFEIRKGESIGIIGPNGSGKTTILKMLNGIFWPDKGKITIRGRVGALIEVGAGFHPMLTGRQNIYINGAILGMCKDEIDNVFDKIVRFADIGDFLDSPVKYYSSGMFVRLGFAIAVHCNQDILLIDEVLAVGDKDFQIKCFQKLHEIKKRGTTIILVSHNEYAIREQTTKCLYLDRGKMEFFGPSEDTINLYIKNTLGRRFKMIPEKDLNLSVPYKKAEIVTLRFLDQNGNEINYIESGQEIQLLIECIIHEKLNKPIFGVHFYDNFNFMYCANSYYENVSFNNNLLGRIRIHIKIPEFHLPLNTYFCSVIISDENVENLIDWHNMAYRLVVGRAKNARGSIKLPTDWKIEKI